MSKFLKFGDSDILINTEEIAAVVPQINEEVHFSGWKRNIVKKAVIWVHLKNKTKIYFIVEPEKVEEKVKWILENLNE